MNKRNTQCNKICKLVRAIIQLDDSEEIAHSAFKYSWRLLLQLIWKCAFFCFRSQNIAVLFLPTLKTANRTTRVGNAEQKRCLSEILYLRYHRTSWVFLLLHTIRLIYAQICSTCIMLQGKTLQQSLLKTYNHWHRQSIIGLLWIPFNSFHLSIFVSLSHFSRTLFPICILLRLAKQSIKYFLLIL